MNSCDLSIRKLQKLDIPPSKIKIGIEYNIDYDSERDQYKFSDQDHVVLIDGRIISWDDVKRNGIAWIVITLIDDNEKENCIADIELA